MFSSGPNYPKLKTNLKLAISRLKLLQKKKTELTEKSRKEIADYIAAGKYERAKVRVEYIIREDYLVEALEIVEMYCDLLLARFGLISNMKELDEGISEAVSSLIWVAPRLMSDIQELKVIADLLTAKYGPSFAEACRVESIESISTKLKHKMSIQSPAKLLVEKYVIEIARCYNVDYEPDEQILALEKGNDAMLIDLSGGVPQPPGFLGYPQPPPLPHFTDVMPGPAPFAYPPLKEKEGGPSAPPSVYSYNPGDEKEFGKDFTDSNLPRYSSLYPDANLQVDDNDSASQDEVTEVNPNDQLTGDNPDLENYNNNRPTPAPRNKMNDLPELPSVPSALPPPGGSNEKEDEVDFDDLARRFNALKKK